VTSGLHSFAGLFPGAADVAGLSGFDPYGLDGPRQYEGLGFVPVPGNPRGLARLSEGAATLAGESIRAAAILDGVGETTWEGADAEAFRARLSALPPALRDYGRLLRQFGVLVSDAGIAVRAGKAHAEALDREATVLRRLLTEAVPSWPVRYADLTPELDQRERRLGAILREAAGLRRRVSARLADIGNEIDRLSRHAPHLPTAGLARWVDDGADALGHVDRLLIPLGAQVLIDRFSAEAHLAAGLARDGAGVVAGHPGGAALATVLNAASLGVDARIYRIGATNSRGEALLRRADLVTAALAVVPLRGRSAAAGLHGAAGSVGQVAEVATPGSPVVGSPPTGPVRVAADATARSGLPFVPSVLEYTDNRWGSVPRSAAPDVRVRQTPPPPCPVSSGDEPPGRPGPR
jgi:hypothetical protein